MTGKPSAASKPQQVAVLVGHAMCVLALLSALVVSPKTFTTTNEVDQTEQLLRQAFLINGIGFATMIAVWLGFSLWFKCIGIQGQGTRLVPIGLMLAASLGIPFAFVAVPILYIGIVWFTNTMWFDFDDQTWLNLNTAGLVLWALAGLLAVKWRVPPGHHRVSFSFSVHCGVLLASYPVLMYGLDMIQSG